MSSMPPGGKNPLVANVAIARELAGWCWSLATMQ
jgi:transposase